jgi:recombination protein RecA
LRADATRTGRAPPLFRCETLILKDKRQGPGRTFAELCHGPDGLS